MVRYLGPGSLIWVIPDYKSGYEKARLVDRETADNYIAHTHIGDPVMDAVVEWAGFHAVWRYAGHLMGRPKNILFTDESQALHLSGPTPCVSHHQL